MNPAYCPFCGNDEPDELYHYGGWHGPDDINLGAFRCRICGRVFLLSTPKDSEYVQGLVDEARLP